MRALFAAPAHGSYWHEVDLGCPPNGRYRGQSGQDVLRLSLPFDPKRTQRLCATLVLRGVSVAGP